MDFIIDVFSSPYILLFFSVIGMFSAAFFTGTEIALISADRNDLKKLSDLGNNGASFALILLESVETLLTITQLGTNFSIATTTTLATIFSMFYLGHSGDWRVVVILTPTVLLLCDSVPKVVARSYSVRWSLACSYPLIVVSSVFTPVVKLLSFYTNYVTRLAGIGAPDTLTARRLARDQLFSLLGDKDDEIEIRFTQKRMIRNILDFYSHSVRKAMVPLVNVDAIEGNASVKHAIEMFETLRHSRIPVYRERVDNIVGVLHFMDLFEAKDLDEPVELYMKEAAYAPEHQQLEALIAEMNSKESHMMIVVDEYGGAVGIVTKEDVLEEVVGNLADEFDENTFVFHQISPDTYLVNVTIEIDDLNERLSSNLPKGDYETVSGFLLQQFNRIPSVGDELYFGDLKFKVFKCSDRAILTVIVSKLKSQTPDTR